MQDEYRTTLSGHNDTTGIVTADGKELPGRARGTQTKNPRKPSDPSLLSGIEMRGSVDARIDGLARRVQRNAALRPGSLSGGGSSVSGGRDGGGHGTDGRSAVAVEGIGYGNGDWVGIRTEGPDDPDPPFRPKKKFVTQHVCRNKIIILVKINTLKF